MERDAMGAERSEHGSAGTSPSPADDRSTGLPVLRTWRLVYAFVIVTFVTWVVLLTALERVFP